MQVDCDTLPKLLPKERLKVFEAMEKMADDLKEVYDTCCSDVSDSLVQLPCIYEDSKESFVTIEIRCSTTTFTFQVGNPTVQFQLQQNGRCHVFVGGQNALCRLMQEWGNVLDKLRKDIEHPSDLYKAACGIVSEQKEKEPFYSVCAKDM